MALSDMQVFNQYIMPLVTQRFPQMIDLFNAASNNTIILTAEGFDGDFLERSFYNALHSARYDVDMYAANGSRSNTDMSQGKDADVKVARGFGPIAFEEQQLAWLRKPTQEGSTVIADQFVEALVADQFNTAIGAVLAALDKSETTLDETGGTNAVITQARINSALALLGDMSRMIGALVMTGTAYHTLIGQAIDNANSLFTIGGLAVTSGTTPGQGRPIIVTDAPALRVAGTPATQNVLGLTNQAVTVMDQGNVQTNIHTPNGTDRLVTTIQSQYSFGMRVKGFTWDTTTGGKSPVTAELETSANWDRTANSIKFGPGVLLKVDET